MTRGLGFLPLSWLLTKAVSQYEVGKADIGTELTSDENQFIVVHESEGYKPGDTETFDIVSKFLRDQRHPYLPFKDQLHAVW
jgi:hypothetical protein